MTPEDGRALERGAQVYFGNDPKDRGVVKDNNGEVLVIHWGRDASVSLHRMTDLGRVHAWRPRVRT